MIETIKQIVYRSEKKQFIEIWRNIGKKFIQSSIQNDLFKRNVNETETKVIII